MNGPRRPGRPRGTRAASVGRRGGGGRSAGQGDGRFVGRTDERHPPALMVDVGVRSELPDIQLLRRGSSSSVRALFDVGPARQRREEIRLGKRPVDSTLGLPFDQIGLRAPVAVPSVGPPVVASEETSVCGGIAGCAVDNFSESPAFGIARSSSALMFIVITGCSAPYRRAFLSVNFLGIAYSNYGAS